MRNLRNLGFLVAVILLAGWPASSQMSFRTPELRGVFNPTVGAGADYQSTAANNTSNMEISIVGKEDVAGKTGYWVEIATTQRGNQQFYIKDLMVVDGGTTTIAKAVMQMGTQPPMDMTAMMKNTGQAASQQIDARMNANQVGSESVTTPAGTFSCQHYQAKDGSWDAWMSPGVGPWGLVKSSDKNGTSMVVTKVITNATDHITGTPQQMDMQQLMRQAQQQGGQAPR